MKRLLTSLVLLPLVCYVVIWAPQWLFLTVLIVVAVLCYHEYSVITAAYGFGSGGPLRVRRWTRDTADFMGWRFPHYGFSPYRGGARSAV